jgi:beta-N-acetylhexosaminidase
MADEEGGGIQRLAGAVSSIPWPRAMAATMSRAQVRAAALTVGRQMKALGVGVDLAPVLDVDGGVGPSLTNADGSRSFSADPQVAAGYGVAFFRGLRDARVLAVVKHFPGLGGAAGNTDVGPVATQPLSALRTGGLVPFRAAVNAGARAVMVSNASVPGLTTRPASLSARVINGLLRRQLGFTGLVVTDSLSAGAIRQASPDLPAATVAAVGSGADLVLFGSTLTPADTARLSATGVARTFHHLVSALAVAVRSGALSTRRLNAAVAEVLTAKGMHLCG